MNIDDKMDINEWNLKVCKGCSLNGKCITLEPFTLNTISLTPCAELRLALEQLEPPKNPMI